MGLTEILGLVLVLGQLVVGYFIKKADSDAASRGRWDYITAHAVQIALGDIATALNNKADWPETAVKVARDIVSWAESDPHVGMLSVDEQAKIASYARSFVVNQMKGGKTN